MAKNQDHRNQGLGHWRPPGYSRLLPNPHARVALGFPKPRARTSPLRLLLYPPDGALVAPTSWHSCSQCHRTCHHSSSETAALLLNPAPELQGASSPTPWAQCPCEVGRPHWRAYSSPETGRGEEAHFQVGKHFRPGLLYIPNLPPGTTLLTDVGLLPGMGCPLVQQVPALPWEGCLESPFFPGVQPYTPGPAPSRAPSPLPFFFSHCFFL